MSYNLLVVTDHSTHSSSNSLYELSVALLADQRSRNIWVCSRGLEENDDFFQSIPNAPIYASSVKEAFAFDPAGFFLHQTSVLLDKNEIDAILIRMPQPLDKTFLLSLEKIVHPDRIINNPKGTIETSSKEFLLQVAHFCPSPQMVGSIEEAVALSHEKEIVLKPLYSYGGRGIARLSSDYFWQGINKYSADRIFQLLRNDQFPMLAMSYLKNVSFGDKRTIVVNQHIIGSALRMPAENSWICNVAQGGHAFISAPDTDELVMERELTPMLYDKGVIMYGFDTLVNDEGKRVLSEINTLSIGGLGPMTEMSGKPLLSIAAGLVWDYLEKG